MPFFSDSSSCDKHLKRLLITHEIFEMIQDEDSNAQFRFGHIIETLFKPFENGREGMLLNEEEKTLFGFEVMIKSRQRHAVARERSRMEAPS